MGWRQRTSNCGCSLCLRFVPAAIYPYTPGRLVAVGEEILGVQSQFIGLPDPAALRAMHECWSTSCFPPDTPVVMADGRRVAISQVRPGDVVRRKI